MFSDDPAPQTQAFTELRRSPLSFPAAAWPCRKVLMNPAPLSRRLSFSTSYHHKPILSIGFFDFIIPYNPAKYFTPLNCHILPILSSTTNKNPIFRKKGLTFPSLCAIMQKLSAQYAAIAQSVERILGKDEVASSNLASSSKKKPGIPTDSGFLLFTEKPPR